VVFLDSLSSLQAIESCKVENPLILKILKDHNQLINSGKSVTFCWIPSDVYPRVSTRVCISRTNAVLVRIRFRYSFLMCLPFLMCEKPPRLDVFLSVSRRSGSCCRGRLNDTETLQGTTRVRHGFTSRPTQYYDSAGSLQPRLFVREQRATSALTCWCFEFTVQTHAWAGIVFCDDCIHCGVSIRIARIVADAYNYRRCYFVLVRHSLSSAKLAIHRLCSTTVSSVQKRDNVMVCWR